jgi:effector-binding domain-containing protein
LAALAALPAGAATAGPAEEQAVSIHLKDTEPRTVAVMEHQGPYTEIPGVISRLAAEIEKGGHVMYRPVMCTFFNSPENTPEDKLSWEVRIPVVYPGKLQSGGVDKMGFAYLAPSHVAYTFHVGEHMDISQKYAEMMSWAEANGYELTGYPTELYWAGPDEAPADRMVTELWIPVEKRETERRIKR